MKAKIQSVKVVACTHNGKLNGHIVPRHLKNKGSADDMWDVEARIVRESDFRAMQRIVRNAADMPCKCVAVNLNNCLSCQARKVRGKK